MYILKVQLPISVMYLGQRWYKHTNTPTHTHSASLSLQAEPAASVNTDTNIDPTSIFVMDSNNNFITVGTLISVWERP